MRGELETGVLVPVEGFVHQEPAAARDVVMKERNPAPAPLRAAGAAGALAPARNVCLLVIGKPTARVRGNAVI